ncbi:MAG: hypothetical protein GXP21_01745 [Gammaproteobacteria bacterium]|nr:hypothetical protein [Gammaproteobacteria bacterium]
MSLLIEINFFVVPAYRIKTQQYRHRPNKKVANPTITTAIVKVIAAATLE